MFDDKSFLFSRLILPLSLIVGGFALFLALEGCISQPSSGTELPSSVEPEKARRIALDAGIVVEDMDASLAFYSELLGLPVIAEVRTSLIGKGTMVQLKHGESLIKLLQMDTPPSSKSAVGIASTYGYRYITLMVSDIEHYATKAAEAELQIAMPLTELGNGAKIMMVEDPDGNIVEFVEEAM